MMVGISISKVDIRSLYGKVQYWSYFSLCRLLNFSKKKNEIRLLHYILGKSVDINIIPNDKDRHYMPQFDSII